MKTLTKPQITVEGDTVTIVAKVEDLPFNGMLVTRVSHLHLHEENSRHPRRVQSSNEAIFIESPNGKMAIPNGFFAEIAAHVAPETSFAPMFRKCSKPCCVETVSETPVKFQWQVSDNAFPEADKPHTPPPAAVWSDIEGATERTINEDSVPSGKWIRCVATNSTGTTITKPAQKK